jgi:hypothetical protein
VRGDELKATILIAVAIIAGALFIFIVSTSGQQL